MVIALVVKVVAAVSAHATSRACSHVKVILWGKVTADSQPQSNNIFLRTVIRTPTILSTMLVKQVDKVD